MKAGSKEFIIDIDSIKVKITQSYIDREGFAEAGNKNVKIDTNSLEEPVKKDCVINFWNVRKF